MTAPQIPGPLERFVAAINDGDTDAFVDAFTDDGYVDDWGRRLTGRDGVRSWAQTDAIGAGAQMEVLEADQDGDVVTIRFGWRSSVFNGESTGIAVLDGDKLASFTIPPHR